METFRPLFVYALHLTQANPNQNRWLADEQAVKNDLSSLLATARSANPERHNPYLETVWYAVNSWLHEMLDVLPNGFLVAQALLPATDPGGAEFYRRLGNLLTPDDNGVIPPEAVEAIRIYSFCLEHEYRGYYARPGCEHQRQAYRRRCRQTLEAVLSPSDLPPDPEPKPTARSQFRKVALWAAPVAGTILLYGIYRVALKDLYFSVVG